ncbi:MAG: isochorismatase family protein [Pirellulales bacterium]
MPDTTPLHRSTELLSVADSGLLVVDVQEKLIGLVPEHRRIVWNIGRLLDGAKVLGVFAAATEQYPQGLGPTTPVLAQRFESTPDNPVPAKTMFSCRGCASTFDGFRRRGLFKLLVVGIETHVCIQQTVLDAMANGFRVYVAVDAVGARFAVDHETALRRMESCGATLTTTESALFEWCEVAGTPQFKEISRIVRQAMPE